MQPPEVYTFPNSYFQFEGSWQKDVNGAYTGSKVGPGILTLGNGTTIEAEFVDDEIQGFAKILWADDSTYEGQVVEGTRDGEGKLVDPGNRITYEGQWKRNQFHGYGHLVTPTETYDGDFHFHKYSGHGKLCLEDGTTYLGQFVEGMFEGNGELTTGSKREPVGLGGGQIKYKGQFRVNIREGMGHAECLMSHLTYNGEWQDDLPGRIGEFFDLVDDGGISMLPFREFKVKPMSRQTASRQSDDRGVHPGDGEAVEAEPPPPPPPCVLNAENTPCRWTLKVLDKEGKELSEEGNRPIHCAMYKDIGEEGGAVVDEDELSSRLVLELRNLIHAGDMEIAWRVLPPAGKYVFIVEDQSPESMPHQDICMWRKLDPVKLHFTVENDATAQ